MSAGRARIIIFPAAIPGKKESPRRPQARERHATAKYDAAAEVPDLRRASRRAEGHLAMRRARQQADSHRPNKRIGVCQATIHRQSTCPRRQATESFRARPVRLWRKPRSVSFDTLCNDNARESRDVKFHTIQPRNDSCPSSSIPLFFEVSEAACAIATPASLLVFRRGPTQATLRAIANARSPPR